MRLPPLCRKAEIDAMLGRLQASATSTSTTAPTRSPGAMSAASSITRSCSNGSPTWRSTRPSTPQLARFPPAPRAGPAAGARPRRRAMVLSGGWRSSHDHHRVQQYAARHHPVCADVAPRSPANKGGAAARDGLKPRRRGLTMHDVSPPPGLLDRARARRLPGRASHQGRPAGPDYGPRRRDRPPRSGAAAPAVPAAAGDTPAPAEAATARPSRPSARPRRSRPRPPPAKAAPADKPTRRAGTKQALHDRAAQAARGRDRRADRRRHRMAEAYDPRRHLRRAQEEARPQRRGHAHPRGRPQQDRRQEQHHRLPDHRMGRLR